MNASVIDRLLDYLMPLFSLWGYPIVFVGVFLESLFLTGWIAPGTTVVLLGSFYAAHSELNVFLIGTTAFFAALLGDIVGFYIGRRLGREAVERYGNRPRLRRGMERGQRFFSRYGGTTVFFGRVLSGVDAFIPLTAGLNAMPWWKYLCYDVPGIMLWTSIFTALGYFFGASWQTIDRVIDGLGWGLIGVIAFVIILVYGVGRRRRAGEPGSVEGGEEPRGG